MHQTTFKATILSGAQLSNIVDLGGNQLVGFLLPTMTSTALTFNNCADGQVGTELYTSAGAAISHTIASNRYVALSDAEQAYFSGVRYLQLNAGSSEGADRSIQLVTVTR